MVMQNCIKSNMRERLIRIGATFVLVLCIWGHVSEIFDHWDNTFQTGNDVEYSTVIVMLVAGATIAFAYAVALNPRKASITSYRPPVLAAHILAPFSAGNFIGHSPPRPLRI
jgi:hypothetical protein